MASCPRCQARVGLRAVLSQTGLAGVVCPNCQTSLEPTYWSQALALFAGLLAAYAAGHWLRSLGAGALAEFAGWVGAFLSVYLALLAAGVRLRPKRSENISLKQDH